MKTNRLHIAASVLTSILLVGCSSEAAYENRGDLTPPTPLAAVDHPDLAQNSEAVQVASADDPSADTAHAGGQCKAPRALLDDDADDPPPLPKDEKAEGAAPVVQPEDKTVKADIEAKEAPALADEPPSPGDAQGMDFPTSKNGKKEIISLSNLVPSAGVVAAEDEALPVPDALPEKTEVVAMNDPLPLPLPPANEVPETISVNNLVPAHVESTQIAGASNPLPADEKVETISRSTADNNAFAIPDHRRTLTADEPVEKDAARKQLAEARELATPDPSSDTDVFVDNGQKGETVRVGVVSWRDLPFKTVKRQAFDFSCGSAAVATLMTYEYNMPTTEKAVFREMFDKGDKDKIRREGFSMLDMSHYLNAHGLEAKGFRIKEESIGENKLPFIALINNNGYNHFVVVKTMGNGRILVGDPSSGNTEYSRDAFEKIWNGLALVVVNNATTAREAFANTDEWRYVRAKAPIRDGNDLGNERAGLSPVQWQIAPTTGDILPATMMGLVAVPGGGS